MVSVSLFLSEWEACWVERFGLECSVGAKLETISRREVDNRSRCNE